MVGLAIPKPWTPENSTTPRLQDIIPPKWTNWVVPPPRMPVANEGLVRDPLLKMVHNPGGDCYWEGGQPNGQMTKNVSLLLEVIILD